MKPNARNLYHLQCECVKPIIWVNRLPLSNGKREWKSTGVVRHKNPCSRRNEHLKGGWWQLWSSSFHLNGKSRWKIDGNLLNFIFNYSSAVSSFWIIMQNLPPMFVFKNLSWKQQNKTDCNLHQMGNIWGHVTIWFWEMYENLFLDWCHRCTFPI